MQEALQKKIVDFFAVSKPLNFKKGEIILRSDDEPQGVYFLENGYVKMNTVFEDGRELTLNIFKPRTYFPMTWAISDIPNSYYFVTMTPSVVRRVSKKEFLQFLNNNPDVLMDFTHRILVGLNGLLQNIQHLLSGDSYHRVVSAVLLSVRRFGDPKMSDKISLQIPLTHQDIADIAGITRETASLAIGRLIEAGIITHHYRRMIVNNLKALESEAQIPQVLESDPAL